MTAPKMHVVRPQDTLSGIAAAYGFPAERWRWIYDAACNADLRRARPDPKLIRPGDRVLVPPNPAEMRALLSARLAALRALRRDTEAMFARIDAEADRTFREYSVNANVMDWTAAMLVRVKDVVKAGVAAMKLTGEALAKANAQLGWSALDFAYTPLYEVAVKQQLTKIELGEPLQGGFGAAAAVIANLTTPSFWAQVYVNRQQGAAWERAAQASAGETQRAVKQRVSWQRDAVLREVDHRIARTQEAWLDAQRDPASLYRPTPAGGVKPWHAR